MADEMQAAEASEALAEIRNRERQVIDLATVPSWYWWAVGALMVVLAVGVDTRTAVAIGLTVPVFVIGMLSATGLAVRGQFRAAQLRRGLLDGRGVAAILAFVALIIGITLGTAFALRGAGVSYPATWACLAGGVVMGLGGPPLMRTLRRIMLGNRAGSPR
ncbi:MAG TPA: hypothetical protein VLM11_04540 [Streptosporangiaceae bacterium]|nr:hypothetical protein [Streptosporangiaceae bacterium]